MTIKQVLLSIIIFILPNRDSLAQVLFDDYTLTTWNSKNGLPSELILDLTRDNDNFLWLSTYEGLFRFDGVQFKTFNNTTHAAFKTNNFYRPTVDKKNNLWIPTQFGAFLKLRGNGVKTISGMPKTNGAITKFENGEFLYMTSENEYLFLNPTTLKYRIKSLSDVAKQLRKETNSDIAANLPDGRMIMINILRKIFMVEGDSIRLLFKAEGVKTDMNFTSNLLRTSLNEILIVHDNGLKIWKDNRLEIYPGTEQIKINTLGSNRKPLLVEDKLGNLWLGHNNGVALRKKGEQAFQFLTKSHSLYGVIVTCINLDDENNIWLGTETGLHKITLSKIKTISDIGTEVLKRTIGVAQRKNGDVIIMAPAEYSLYKHNGGKTTPIILKSKDLKGSWESFQVIVD